MPSIYLWLSKDFFLQAQFALLFLFGLVVGSFLNVCIYRIPKGNFFQKARSYCPHCGSAIPFFHNIPVFSFVCLRGKAACCAKKISWQYPTVELLTAILFILCYIKFPFLHTKWGGYSYYPQELIRFSHAVIFASLLLVCSFIDLRHMIIPNRLSLGMILISPLLVVFHPELDWKSAALGFLLGGGLFILLLGLIFYYENKKVLVWEMLSFLQLLVLG